MVWQEKDHLRERGQSMVITDQSHPTPLEAQIPFDPASGVILDPIVMAQYYGVLSRYDFASGGAQTFTVFLPSSGTTDQLVVTDNGLVPVRMANGVFTARQSVVS